MTSFQIGVDFDNTIVSYDGVFHKAAVEKGLIPQEVASSKGAVRDYLCSKGQENTWTELQGYVYGTRMELAQPYPGVHQFFSFCKLKRIPVFIISHKTLYPFLGPVYDLHKAANQWLSQQKLAAIPAFFELTLKKKLERIKQQNCTVFIDDLPEIFAEEMFPHSVSKILFNPHGLHSPGVINVNSWGKIIEMFQNDVI